MGHYTNDEPAPCRSGTGFVLAGADRDALVRARALGLASPSEELRLKVPTALVGCQVHRTAFDYQVRLVIVALDAGGDYRVDAELVIEAPFLLRDVTGEWHELDPGAGSALAPVLDLFMKTIVGVEIRTRGTLALAFDDGGELIVGADPWYESWTLSGRGVDDVVVGPGGCF